MVQSNRINDTDEKTGCYTWQLLRTETPTYRYRVRSIVQPSYSDFRGYQGHCLYGVKEEHGSGVFLGLDLSSKTMPTHIGGPCTKCIITHTIFPVEVSVLEQLLSVSGYSRAIPLPQSDYRPSRAIPQIILSIMLLVHSGANFPRLSSSISPHYQRRACGLLISSLKRFIMFCSLSAYPCQMCHVQIRHHLLTVSARAASLRTWCSSRRLRATRSCGDAALAGCSWSRSCILSALSLVDL